MSSPETFPAATSASPVRGLSAARRYLTNIELIGAGILLAVLAFIALFGHLLRTHDPMAGDLLARFKPVGAAGFWLGSDHLGRDLWSRVVSGLQWSMACAFTANCINLAVGTTLGLIAAERDGWARAMIHQVVYTFQSFPALVVMICVAVVVGQGFAPLVLTLGLLAWVVYMRVTYAEASSLYQRDYVRAARLAGAGRWSIMFEHILPGLRASLFVIFAFHFASLLIIESALSFLGIGAPLGVPTWGNMLAESRQYLFKAPWMMLVPAGAIVTAVVTMNLLGDGIARLARRKGPDIDI